MTILCLASYHKGHEFLREARRQGCRVLLVTSESLRYAAWPREAIDDIFFVPDVDKAWQLDDLIRGVSQLARSTPIHRIVALDDFDMEKASALREHLRVPGMGDTTTRYFRDKLAMRVKAASSGLPVPPFAHVLNDEALSAFCRDVPAPWMLKPRHQAGSIGLQKLAGEDEVRTATEALGDRRSDYLIEGFVPGTVFHVDSVVYDNEVRFAVASRYGTPPFEVSHGGGVFTSILLERGSDDEQAVCALNARLLAALGLVRGVSHSEYIKGADGHWYFLETSARVGGAHIADLVEAASGVNLWAEWAKVEVAGGTMPYALEPVRPDYAALLVSLARQEWPDTHAFADPEVVWRLHKRHHVGFIVRSPLHTRVVELINAYGRRVVQEFLATMPLGDKATE